MQSTRQEIEELHETVSQLNLASESYESEIERLQNELRNAYRQMQEQRRNLADSIEENKDKQASLKCEIESLKTHIYKIETHMITYKLHYAEDSSFLREELRIAERIATESKVAIASLAEDKEYFHEKYKSLISYCKNNKYKEAEAHSYLR